MVDFGVFNVMQQRSSAKTSHEVFHEAADQVRAAEELGFHEAWFVEHHASNYSLCPSPLVMAAHCAGFTKNIRLGTAVLVAPLYHPARLLAEIAMVDTLSNGRLDIGMGTGYQAYEFSKFGVELDNNQAMTLELLDLIERGLTERSITHDGEHYPIDEIAVSVETAQDPHPPIWLATSNPEIQQHAVRQGHRMFISGHLGGPRYMEAARNRIIEAHSAAGMPTDEPDIGMLRLAFVSKDKAEVAHYADCARYQQRIAAALKQRRERVSDDHMVEEVPFEGEPELDQIIDRLPIGDPDTVISRVVDECRRLKPRQIIIQPQVGDISHEVAMKSLELWATEVMPAVAHELAPAKAAS